jgi:hypothetical protein
MALNLTKTHQTKKCAGAGATLKGQANSPSGSPTRREPSS